MPSVGRAQATTISPWRARPPGARRPDSAIPTSGLRNFRPMRRTDRTSWRGSRSGGVPVERRQEMRGVGPGQPREEQAARPSYAADDDDPERGGEKHGHGDSPRRPGERADACARSAERAPPEPDREIGDEDDQREDDADQPGRGDHTDAQGRRRRQPPLDQKPRDRENEQHDHQHVGGRPRAVRDEQRAAEEEHRPRPAGEDGRGAHGAQDGQDCDRRQR